MLQVRGLDSIRAGREESVEIVAEPPPKAPSAGLPPPQGGVKGGLTGPRSANRAPQSRLGCLLNVRCRRAGRGWASVWRNNL